MMMITDSCDVEILSCFHQVLSPDVIPSFWLGSKHWLTNSDHCEVSVAQAVTLFHQWNDWQHWCGSCLCQSGTKLWPLWSSYRCDIVWLVTWKERSWQSWCKSCLCLGGTKLWLLWCQFSCDIVWPVVEAVFVSVTVNPDRCEVGEGVTLVWPVACKQGDLAALVSLYQGKLSLCQWH